MYLDGKVILLGEKLREYGNKLTVCVEDRVVNKLLWKITWDAVVSVDEENGLVHDRAEWRTFVKGEKG